METTRHEHDGATLRPSDLRIIPLTEEHIDVRCPICGHLGILTAMRIILPGSDEDPAAESPYLRLTLLCEAVIVRLQDGRWAKKGCDRYRELAFVPTSWTGTSCGGESPHEADRSQSRRRSGLRPRHRAEAGAGGTP